MIPISHLFFIFLFFFWISNHGIKIRTNTALSTKNSIVIYHTFGELIYTCKIGFLAGSNLQVRIKPDIFSRFSQPEHFSRFKPANLLLNRARFAGNNLCYNLTFLAGLNLQVQTWINIQVSPDNPILQVQINSPSIHCFQCIVAYEDSTFVFGNQ